VDKWQFLFDLIPFFSLKAVKIFLTFGNYKKSGGRDLEFFAPLCGCFFLGRLRKILDRVTF
jgi:hypothetical protein